MLLQHITVQFSKSTLKPSVYTLNVDKGGQLRMVRGKWCRGLH